MTAQLKDSVVPGTSLARMLLTLDETPCPFECTYCFSRFPQYEGATQLRDVRSHPEMLRAIDVVYPACDTDLFTRRDALDVIEEIASFGVSISVSTKAIISKERLAWLTRMSADMRKDGLVLKIGVSVTSKSKTSLIEPNVPSYSSRMRQLEALTELGIPTALVLRPLQASVPISEYEEILVEAASYCDHVLLGDEWLAESESVRPPAVGHEVTREPVRWLPGSPIWEKQRVAGRESHLAGVARRLGLEAFTSDTQLMARLIDASRKGRRGNG